MPQATNILVVWLVLVSTGGCSASLLVSNGVYIFQDGEAREIASTWRVVISLGYPHFEDDSHQLFLLNETIEHFKNIPQMSDRYPWYHSRLSKISRATPPRWHPSLADGTRGDNGVSSEVQRYLERMKAAVHNQDSAVHFKDKLLTLLNATKRLINFSQWTSHMDPRQQITSLVTRINTLTSEMHLNQSDTGKKLVHCVGAAITEFEHQRVMQQHITLFHRRFYDHLHNGFVSPALLWPALLNQVLGEQVLRFVTQKVHLQWYYDNLEVRFIGRAFEELIYRVDIPTFTAHRLKMYSITTVPVYTGDGNIWREVDNIPDSIGLNSDTGLTFETNSCYGHQPQVCAISVLEKRNYCILGMLLGQQEYLKHCVIKLVTSDTKSMFKVTRHQCCAVLSGDGAMIVNKTCSGGLVHKRAVIKQTVGIVSLPPGCYLENEWFILRSRCESESVSTGNTCVETDAALSVNVTILYTTHAGLIHGDKVVPLKLFIIVVGSVGTLLVCCVLLMHHVSLY